MSPILAVNAAFAGQAGLPIASRQTVASWLPLQAALTSEARSSLWAYLTGWPRITGRPLLAAIAGRTSRPRRTSGTGQTSLGHGSRRQSCLKLDHASLKSFIAG